MIIETGYCAAMDLLATSSVAVTGAVMVLTILLAGRDMADDLEHTGELLRLLFAIAVVILTPGLMLGASTWQSFSAGVAALLLVRAGHHAWREGLRQRNAMEENND